MEKKYYLKTANRAVYTAGILIAILFLIGFVLYQLNTRNIPLDFINLLGPSIVVFLFSMPLAVFAICKHRPVIKLNEKNMEIYFKLMFAPHKDKQDQIIQGSVMATMPPGMIIDYPDIEYIEYVSNEHQLALSLKSGFTKQFKLKNGSIKQLNLRVAGVENFEDFSHEVKKRIST